MIPAPLQIAAIRERAAVSRVGRDGLVRVLGEGAFDLLDRLLPGEAQVRNRGARPGLLLDEEGRIEADLTLLADGDDYLLISEGLDADALAERLRSAARPGEAVAVLPLPEHRVLDIDGPYAWQILSDLAGEGSTGLRYASWFPLEREILCLRAGQTGEYGYSFILPAAREEALFARILEHGQALDMVEAGPEALAHCRMEAWFFDVRQAPRACPLEWGLQWRLCWDKDFRGAEALRARRGATRAPVAFRAQGPAPRGAPVLLDGEPIGEVGASSDRLGETIGGALLWPPYACVGVDQYMVNDTPLLTVSPPFVRYRSLRGMAGRQRYVREP